jgi:hypothetical protein
MPPGTPLSLVARVHQGSGWDCPECRAPLDVCQPGAQDPDFLLGACGPCAAWFAFYGGDEGTPSLVVRLPAAAEAAAALAATPGGKPPARTEG